MYTSSSGIREDLRKLQEAQPGLRARDMAQALGVSEGALVASGCGHGTTRLAADFPAQIAALQTLGEVMALTRNAHAVIEKVGAYENFEHHGHASQVIGEQIDLRLFLGRFHVGFTETKEGPRGTQRSIQYFDESGQAVHKVHLRAASDVAAFAAFVDRFRAPNQSPEQKFTLAADKVPLRSDAEIDVAGLRRQYEQMKDTHELFHILRTFEVGRLQALRLLGPEHARKVQSLALRTLLQAAAERELPIMIFVGSVGVIQIHTGPVRTLRQYGDWFNVMDPGFNLHLHEPGIASAWVVRKPTADGFVSSLELYDDREETILLAFSKRKPGQCESAEWRALLAGLELPAPSH